MRGSFGLMLAPLLLLAGCGDKASDPRGVGRDEVLLQVSATGRADTRPDEARITLGVDNLGATAAAATDAGANVLSGPNLAISDPEAANRSAYAAAYRAARAEAYAAAAEMRVARVLLIRDTGGGRDGPVHGYETGMPSPEEGLMRAVNAAPPPPDVRPGTTTSQVQVRADFALAPR